MVLYFILFFHSSSILNWLGNEIHGLFLSTFYKVIMISNKCFFLGRCLILQVSIFIIKIIYKNNKVIKPIEIHDPGHKVTEVNSIWHRLNILKNNYRLKVFLKVISYFYRSSKLFLNPLNWLIHFGSTPTQFNCKLELGKESCWQVSWSNHLIGFNDTIKKIFMLFIFFNFF